MEGAQVRESGRQVSLPGAGGLLPNPRRPPSLPCPLEGAGSFIAGCLHHATCGGLRSLIFAVQVVLTGHWMGNGAGGFQDVNADPQDASTHSTYVAKHTRETSPENCLCKFLDLGLNTHAQTVIREGGLMGEIQKCS